MWGGRGIIPTPSSSAHTIVTEFSVMLHVLQASATQKEWSGQAQHPNLTRRCCSQTNLSSSFSFRIPGFYLASTESVYDCTGQGASQGSTHSDILAFRYWQQQQQWYIVILGVCIGRRAVSGIPITITAPLSAKKSFSGDTFYRKLIIFLKKFPQNSNYVLTSSSLLFCISPMASLSQVMECSTIERLDLDLLSNNIPLAFAKLSIAAFFSSFFQLAKGELGPSIWPTYPKNAMHYITSYMYARTAPLAFLC